MPLVSKPLHVYIAGPFRAESQAQKLRNVAKVVELAGVILEAGHVPVYVHGNALVAQPNVPVNDILDADCEILSRCDAALFAPGSLDSAGACEERGRALGLRLPTFMLCSSEDLRDQLVVSDKAALLYWLTHVPRRFDA